MIKLVVLVLCAATLCASAATDEETINKWMEFQKTFGKTYRSPVETQRRLSIFAENLKKIDAHNALYEQGQTTYTKGINRFADWTSDEFKEYLNKGVNGAEKPLVDNDFIKIFERNESVPLPDSIDWRDHGAVTPVQTDWGCHADWTFSALGAIEGQLALQKNELVLLSAQELIDCTYPFDDNTCDHGGYRLTAYDYIRQHGIANGYDYYYQPLYAETCHRDLFNITTYVSHVLLVKNTDESALQEAIATKGPVSVVMCASDAFQHYKSGILIDEECVGDIRLNLRVLAVGYGTEDGQDYYLLKYSQGPKWGENGYFRSPRNSAYNSDIAYSAFVPIL